MPKTRAGWKTDNVNRPKIYCTAIPNVKILEILCETLCFINLILGIRYELLCLQPKMRQASVDLKKKLVFKKIYQKGNVIWYVIQQMTLTVYCYICSIVYSLLKIISTINRQVTNSKIWLKEPERKGIQNYMSCIAERKHFDSK